ELGAVWTVDPCSRIDHEVTVGHTEEDLLAGGAIVGKGIQLGRQVKSAGLGDSVADRCRMGWIIGALEMEIIITAIVATDFFGENRVGARYVEEAEDLGESGASPTTAQHRAVRSQDPEHRIDKGARGSDHAHKHTVPGASAEG